MTVTAACLAFRVSRRWYHRWRPRWQAEGPAGLCDRSCRPRSSPQRLSRVAEGRIVALREASGWGADRIAPLLGLPRSTVQRVLQGHGLRRVKAVPRPITRSEYAAPGAMVHADTKKLGRIVGGAGQRIHGDHSQRHRGVGWEVLHVLIDDATRLGYAEFLPDEKGRTTALFLVTECAGSGNEASAWIAFSPTTAAPTNPRPGAGCAGSPGSATAAPSRITPQTNGKAERWIKTLLQECLYLEAFSSDQERAKALTRILRWYNRDRPHRALNGLTPSARLAQLQAA